MTYTKLGAGLHQGIESPPHKLKITKGNRKLDGGHIAKLRVQRTQTAVALRQVERQYKQAAASSLHQGSHWQKDVPNMATRLHGNQMTFLIW